MRNGRWRDRRLAANVGAGMAAGVTKLDRDFGAAAMNRIGQAPQTGNETVVVNSDFAAPVPSDFFRRGHLDRDQPGAALNACQVVGDAFLGDETFVVRRARRHRWHDDPVLDFDRPDPRRGEKDVHLINCRVGKIVCAVDSAWASRVNDFAHASRALPTRCPPYACSRGEASSQHGTVLTTPESRRRRDQSWRRAASWRARRRRMPQGCRRLRPCRRESDY